MFNNVAGGIVAPQVLKAYRKNMSQAEADVQYTVNPV